MSESSILVNATNFVITGMNPSEPAEEVKSCDGRKHKAAAASSSLLTETETDLDADVEDEELVSVTAQNPMGGAVHGRVQQRIGTHKGNTPETTMALMRRTPGANMMRRSANTRMKTHGTKGTAPIPFQVKTSSFQGNEAEDDEEEDTGTGPLGYGLNIPSPMQAGAVAVNSQANTPVTATHKKALSLESIFVFNRASLNTISSSTAAAAITTAAPVAAAATAVHTSTNHSLITPKPARPTQLTLNTSLQLSGEYQGRTNLYTPAGISLAKNQELNLQVLSGTFSPHTVRLTEALDHLLQEDDEEEVETLLHISTHSDPHGITDVYKEGASDMSDKQETTMQDLYSIDSFAESLTGMDRIITQDDYWDTDTTKFYDISGEADFYGTVTDEGEDYEDDYTSSAGSFYYDPSLDQRHQSTSSQPYHVNQIQQQQKHQHTNSLLNVSSRAGTSMIASVDSAPSGRRASESLHHQRTNSGGSSSNGSGTSSLIFTDGTQKSQSLHTTSFHRHTHSAGSSSLGSVQATSVSSVNSKPAARKQDSAYGNAFKPTAMLNSSFERFTRSSSGSTLGSAGAVSIGVDGTSGGLHAILDDGALPRSIRSSEGGAFVPATKQVMGLQTAPSSSSWKPPVPDRSYTINVNQSSSSGHFHQATNSSSMVQRAKRNAGRDSLSAVFCEDKGQPKTSVLKNDVQHSAQSHIQQAPVVIHHHHHHYSNNKDAPFYPTYPTAHPMPTVDEQYYYPNPMVHSLHGAHSPPPLISPYYPYSSSYQNHRGILHPPQYSPETVPHTIMSPLTVPSIYPIPSMGGFYHTRASPVPFTTQPVMGAQAAAAMAWSSEVSTSPIPWQPTAIHETRHSPCFPYSNFHLSSSSSSAVSPTPPLTMGSSWMPVDPYSDESTQRNGMYLPQNSYSNLHPNREHYHQMHVYSDLNVGNNQTWVDRKGQVLESIPASSQDYRRNTSQTSTNESKSNFTYDPHGHQGQTHRKESLVSSSKIIVDNRPWGQSNYKSASNNFQPDAPYPNQEKPGKRVDQILTAQDNTVSDSSRMMQPSAQRITNQKKNLLNETKSALPDWSVPVTEINSARIKPSGPDSLAEPQESDYGESATNRAALKSFYYTFRLKEKESLEAALLFADQSLESKSVPGNLFWRVYLELADLNKRKGNVKEARSFFDKASAASPHSPEVWMEYTKFEEERGHISKCGRLLYEGLRACDFNEALLIRAVKFEEKLSIDNGSRDLTRTRLLLLRLKNISLDKSWRALLEGAMLESRAGNVDTARRVFNFLVHHIPWYGPLYIEFHVLERDLGRLHDSLMVVERGLKENSRYGPLWFDAFKICEILDLQEKNVKLPRLTSMTERALFHISKELIWKVYLEAALAQERAATVDTDPVRELMANSRKAFVKAVLASPENMRWKVWLAAARMEVSFGDIHTARRICAMSYEVVPSKGRATVIIELARLEDFAGNLDLARALLCKAREEYSAEWKVWLESVNLESRNGKRLRAVQFCMEALKLHSGTGRLWSALAQLLQPDGERVYLSVLETAVTAVPKSGEVWCEVARMYLNPLCPTFDPASARKFLNYGIKFTPQYGDSFLETIRLDLVEHYVEPIALYFASYMTAQLQSVSHDDSTLFFQSVKKCIQDICTIVNAGDPLGLHPNLPVELTSLKNVKGAIGVKTDIELRCRNADPNYGLMWFYCRNSPIDSAHVILQRTKHLIREELTKYCFVYLAAWLRRKAVEFFMEKNGSDNMGVHHGDIRLTSQLLRVTISVEDLLQGSCSDIIDAKFCATDFSTGLVQLQRLSITNRKKCLFGVDSLLAQ